MLQRFDGLDIDRLTDIDDYAASAYFTDDERAADLRTRFGDVGVIELTYQISVENMRARMYSALGITEQGFNSGDACRIPWAADQ
jgi:alkylhydroperoxidase family enzyme